MKMKGKERQREEMGCKLNRNKEMKSWKFKKNFVIAGPISVYIENTVLIDTINMSQ